MLYGRRRRRPGHRPNNPWRSFHWLSYRPIYRMLRRHGMNWPDYDAAIETGRPLGMS